MTINLVQQRSATSVWDSRSRDLDPERWLAAAAAAALFVAGVRRRSAFGLLLALAGFSLCWWAATGLDARRFRRARLRQVWPLRREGDETVDEASEESFPASDAPSWTATTGNQ